MLQRKDKKIEMIRRRALLIDLAMHDGTLSYSKMARIAAEEGVAPERYTRQQCERDFQSALAELRADRESVERLRTEQNIRIEVALSGIWPAVVAGKVDAALAAVRLMERQARLFGLDVPQRTQLEITTHIDKVSAMAVAAVDAGMNAAGLDQAQRDAVLAGIRAHFHAGDRPVIELTAS